MNQSQHPSASLPGQSSKLPDSETVVSIVHHSNRKTQKDDELVAIVEHPSLLGEYEVTGSYEPPNNPIEKQWLEQLLTPWGLGAIFILLTANMLLSWSQWSSQKHLAQSHPESNRISQPLSPTSALNSTRETSKNLSLDQLSVLSVPDSSATRISPSLNLNSQTIKKTEAPKTSTSSRPIQTATPKAASNLTNALLPPSLQPSLVQTYPPVLPNSGETVSVPVMPASQSGTPSVPQPQTVAPPVKAAVSPAPVANPPNQKAQQAQLDRERMLEQIRAQQENVTPLGFNHRIRAKLRATENKQDPSQLMEQLQQLQQQKIEESRTVNSGPTNKPIP
ncbi:hypothetical protein [Gloeothece verrucosa]|uniref:Uncharacterized protein n=1 Tax=Gloeothece verrucosa (strain PCC 7822) TaxID=497965 RepID=E0UEF7_GLOV7|nr:hypothetical protein [Gloeothece verrucosa]ADN15403.1 hypothetical protein Cyan7822_3456 [Gloeothece verrucosa PCC 7822]